MLLVGFAAALRQSELVALDREDLRFTREGLVLTSGPRRRTRRTRGVEIGVPRGRKPATCPVLQLEAWLAEPKIPKGLIFRRIRKEGTILRTVSTAGSSHSLSKVMWGMRALWRRTSAAIRCAPGLLPRLPWPGGSERRIMEQTRHKSEKMVRVYVRKGLALQGQCRG